MTLLVVGGAGLYFGTLYVLGMRVHELRVRGRRCRTPGPWRSQRRRIGARASPELFVAGLPACKFLDRPSTEPDRRLADVDLLPSRDRSRLSLISAMDLVRGLHNLVPRHRGCVATIGNYDGVHRGHQHIIAACAPSVGPRGAGGGGHVRADAARVFEGAAAPSRLTRLREKLEALASCGVDRVVVLRFDDRMRGMAAAEFVDRLLVDGLGARHIVVGHDFHFARRREGNIDTLRRRASRARVHGGGGRPVPRRRRARQQFAGARGAQPRRPRARHPPARTAVPHGGRVRLGKRLGRHARLSDGQPRPAPQGRAAVGHLCRAGQRRGPGDHPAVASLGTRPTVDGTDPLLEVHLFDWDGDLYGRISTWTSSPACATSRSSSRSTRWSPRCTGTRRRRGGARHLINWPATRRPLPHGRLQAHRQPARDGLPDEGGPRPARARDARLVGGTRHLREAARGVARAARRSSCTTARRTRTARSTSATRSTRS
jgi:riboflavin kinase / FMN adenylyltransferase